MKAIRFRHTQSETRVTYTTSTTSGIKAKLFGPKTWLSILGFFMLVALFGLAINLNDGFALVAILALSLLYAIRDRQALVAEASECP